MMSPRWFIAMDAIFQILTALVALAVALFALRGFRWIKEKTLYYLFTAFLILSIAFFANGITLAYLATAKVPALRSALILEDIGFLVFYLLSMAAYSILLLAYYRNFKAMDIAPAIALGGGILSLANDTMQFVVTILILAILVVQLSHLVMKRTRNSAIVAASFTLLLAGNVFILLGSFQELIYVVGKVLQLIAFLTLLFLLFRLREPS